MENKHQNSNKKSKHGKFQNIGKIDRILIDIQKKLKDTYQPIALENLTAFERKRIHSFFDHKSEFQTKTYRDGDNYVLKVFPIENLKKMAVEKAQHVLATGETVFLKDLGGYERFIIHDYLKSFEGIETMSSGEGTDRILEIKPKQFGRTLRKIIKKIKIF